MPFTPEQKYKTDLAVTGFFGALKNDRFELPRRFENAVAALGIFVNDVLSDATEEQRREMVSYFISQIKTNKANDPELKDVTTAKLSAASALGVVAVPPIILQCLSVITPSRPLTAMFSKKPSEAEARAEHDKQIDDLLVVLMPLREAKVAATKPPPVPKRTG